MPMPAITILALANKRHKDRPLAEKLTSYGRGDSESLGIGVVRAL